MAKRSEADGRTPLARLLDTPHLERAVPHLAPETLHQIIRHSGLDACGAIVAAATVEQLTSVLDLDLWRDLQPGDDPRFDVERFGEWLELLVDTGEAMAAGTIAAIDTELVIAGLSRYVRVFDAAALVPATATDDDAPDSEAARSEGVSCDLGGYVVRARRTDAWDAIVILLQALDRDHHARFQVIMQGCRRLSSSRPEVDGLDHLLQAPDQLLYDVSLAREERRSLHGYISAADARAFLQAARLRRERPKGSPAVNPVAAAFFRTARGPEPSAGRVAPRTARHASGATPPDAAALDTVAELLNEAGIVPERPRALIGGHDPQMRLAAIRPLMEWLRDADETAYLTRSGELAFLANVLVAGCSVQTRAFTPQEASDAVVGICNLGLERWPEGRPDGRFLADHDLVTAFEAGWAVLHEEVSLFVADQLLAAIPTLPAMGGEARAGLNTLHRELTIQREAKTPWRARDALDAIALLDVPAWVSLVGLLDECPVLPASLTAILEGRSGPVSAAAFEFVSTGAQIALVRAFMARLPRLLGE